MMDRTPPGEKRLKEKERDTEENGKRKSEEGAMIALLRELKEEMANTRIEIRELKESWKAKEERMEKKIEELEERVKELERQGAGGKGRLEEKIEEITEKVKERIGRQGGKGESTGDVGEEVRRLKRIMDEREKKERRNNITIRGLRKGKSSLKEEAKEFLGKEFGIIKENVKGVQVVGREGKEIIIVEMEDGEGKETIMKRKSKLFGGNIFIDHDLTKEEREVQRLLRERARKERVEGKKVKVGYRKMYIENEMYVWNEEAEEIRKRENFQKSAERKE
ncbi:uncharacterized protein PF11_0207-like [Temnothorax curvispinosus]|uniref:Uncharacterized protein PF11_0207-like n=1 Tax=Temnothorax curvispinosus TaxID=300111 RepID=A0A6J1Q7C8_9HYME|nr:uncharacterized protein PF11_0207-like [Temnothorax curvispinosus]